MSDFPSPPRGSGRHSRQPSQFERGRTGNAGQVPPLFGRGHVDDVTVTNPDLYRVPVPGDPDFGEPPEISREIPRVVDPPRRESADLVVPRVFLEPDEMMDRLRARALRFAIVRDAVWIVLGLALVVQWAVVPLLTTLGF